MFDAIMAEERWCEESRDADNGTIRLSQQFKSTLSSISEDDEHGDDGENDTSKPAAEEREGEHVRLSAFPLPPTTPVRDVTDFTVKEFVEMKEIVKTKVSDEDGEFTSQIPNQNTILPKISSKGKLALPTSALSISIPLSSFESHSASKVDLPASPPPPIPVIPTRHRPSRPRQGQLQISKSSEASFPKELSVTAQPIALRRQQRVVRPLTPRRAVLPPSPQDSPPTPVYPWEVPQRRLTFGSPSLEKALPEKPTNAELVQGETYVECLPKLSIPFGDPKNVVFDQVHTRNMPDTASRVADDLIGELSRELQNTHSDLLQNLHDESSQDNLVGVSDIETRRIRRYGLVDKGALGLGLNDCVGNVGVDQADTALDMAEDEGIAEADDMTAFFEEYHIPHGTIEMGEANSDAKEEVNSRESVNILNPMPRMDAETQLVVDLSGDSVENPDSKHRQKRDQLKVHLRGGAAGRPVSSSSTDTSIASWNKAHGTQSDDDRLSEFTFTSDNDERSPTFSEGTLRSPSPPRGHGTGRSAYHEHTQENNHGYMSTKPENAYSCGVNNDYEDHGVRTEPRRLGSPFSSPRRPPQVPRQDLYQGRYVYGDRAPEDDITSTLMGSDPPAASQIESLWEGEPKQGGAHIRSGVKSLRRKKESYSPLVSPVGEARQNVPFPSDTATRHPQNELESSMARNHGSRTKNFSVSNPISHGAAPKPSRHLRRDTTGNGQSGQRRTASDEKSSKGSSSSGARNQGRLDYDLESSRNRPVQGNYTGVVDAPTTPETLSPNSRGNEHNEELFFGGNGADSSANVNRPVSLNSTWSGVGGVSDIGPDDSVTAVMGRAGRKSGGTVPNRLDAISEDANREREKQMCQQQFKQIMSIRMEDHREKMRQVDADPTTTATQKMRIRNDAEKELPRLWEEAAAQTGYSQINKDWKADVPSAYKPKPNTSEHPAVPSPAPAPTPAQNLAPPPTKPHKSSLQKIGRLLRWTLAVPNDPDLKSYSKRKPPNSARPSRPVVPVNTFGAIGAIGQGGGGNVASALAELNENRRRPSSRLSRGTKSSKSGPRESSESVQRGLQSAPPTMSTFKPGDLPQSLRVGGGRRVGDGEYQGFAPSETTYVGTPLTATFGKEMALEKEYGGYGHASPAASGQTGFPTISQAGG